MSEVKTINIATLQPELVAAFVSDNRKAGATNFTVLYNDNRCEEKRLFTNGSSIGYYPRGSRKYGYRFLLEDVKVISCTLPKKINDAEAFAKNAQRLIAILTESGLWANILKNLKDALAIDYETLCKMERPPLESSLMDSVVRWNVKQMNFRPRNTFKEEANRSNQHTLQEIHCALASSKTQFKVRVEGQSYDVSFSYNAAPLGEPMWKEYPDDTKGDGVRRGWYSEEYRGCANGHYYLAINDTHAIYYEDD